MTLGPVSDHAWLVTLKMPAPIRIPTSAAYDSTVPRSRRRRETIGGELDIECELLEFEDGIRQFSFSPGFNRVANWDMNYENRFNVFSLESFQLKVIGL